MKISNRNLACFLAGLLALLFVGTVVALDAYDLAAYVGYYILIDTNVAGDFESADPEKPVKLDNGMIFEFDTYSYSYSYRPDVVILVKPFPDSLANELRKSGAKDWQFYSYALIIEDEIYDVVRVK